MRKFIWLLLFAPLAFYLPAQAASERPNTVITLNAGVYCYNIYEQGPHFDLRTYIEVTIVNSADQCLDPSLPARRPTSELALEIGDVMADSEQGTLNHVVPLSSMALLSGSGDGSTNQWPVKLMKKGTVKFFNEAKKLYVGNLPYSSTGESYLTLPPEIQAFVSEAKPMSPKERSTVIIIIKEEVQEGKKGLNAVNVKLA